MTEVFWSPPPSSIHSLDSVSSLLDLSLLYHLWISGTFLLLTWYITVLLFRIFVTEVHITPLTPYNASIRPTAALRFWYTRLERCVCLASFCLVRTSDSSPRIKLYE